MPITDDLLLVGAGALAASVNAAAGGGTLLSFPALLALGLSPLAANATSNVGLLPGNLGSTFGLRESLADQRTDAIRVGVAAVLGGALGSVLLLVLGSKVFAAAVPVLLLFASALLLAQPLVARYLASRGPPREHGPALSWTVNFLIAVYGGYFGAGQGILFLGAMGLLLRRDLRRVNALKVLSAFIANLISTVTFIVAELVAHPHALVPRAALPLAVGSLIGGYLGVKVVQRLPPQVLRAFASLVGVAIAAWFIFKA